jgi:hypothetical protein
MSKNQMTIAVAEFDRNCAEPLNQDAEKSTENGAMHLYWQCGYDRVS